MALVAGRSARRLVVKLSVRLRARSAVCAGVGVAATVCRAPSRVSTTRPWTKAQAMRDSAPAG